MSRPDAAASAALSAQVIRPVFFAYLDVVGDPFRANTSGRTLELTGTGMVDLDGTFDGIADRFVTISPVSVTEGGTETVTATLRGIRGLDNDVLTRIHTRTNWQGRVARLWRMIRNSQDEQVGGIQHYFTGYMMNMSVSGTDEGTTIMVTIESYLAAFTEASQRTLMNQGEYDPGDLSPAAALAIANGMEGSPLGGSIRVSGAGGGYGGGGGGGIPGLDRVNEL